MVIRDGVCTSDGQLLAHSYTIKSGFLSPALALGQRLLWGSAQKDLEGLLRRRKGVRTPGLDELHGSNTYMRQHLHSTAFMYEPPSSSYPQMPMPSCKVGWGLGSY